MARGDWVCKWRACWRAAAQSWKPEVGEKFWLWNDVRTPHPIHRAIVAVWRLGIAVEVEEIADMSLSLE
jgi:hypothetical protein